MGEDLVIGSSHKKLNALIKNMNEADIFDKAKKESFGES